VTLHLQVQLIDGRFEKSRRRKHVANNVRAVATNYFRVGRAGIRILELAGEFGKVASRKQVLAIQARHNLVGHSFDLVSRSLDRFVVRHRRHLFH
jgi:hypothetical protein